jgi:hypothetical protein
LLLRLAPLALAACIALGGAGCGDSADGKAGGSPVTKPDTAPAKVQFASKIQFANCRDWNRASAARREALIATLEGYTGAPISGSRTAGGARGGVISASRARQFFDGYCGHRFARYFKLYKLYGRASGFGGGG